MHCKGKKNSFGGRKSSFKAHKGMKHVPMNDPDGTRGGSPNNPSLMNPNQMTQNRMLNNAVNASSSSQGTGGTGDNRTLAGAALGLGGAYLLYKGIKGLAGKIKESPRFQGSLLGTSNQPRLDAKAERNRLRQANKNRRFATNKDGSLKPGFVKTPDGSIERKVEAPIQKIDAKPVELEAFPGENENKMKKATPPPPRDKPYKKTRAQRQEDRKNEKRLKGFYKEGEKEGKRILKDIDKKEKQDEKDKKKRVGGIKKELNKEKKFREKTLPKLKKRAARGNKKAQQQLEMLDPETGRPPTFEGGNRAQFAAGALLTAAAPMLKKAAVSAVANVAAKKLMPEQQAAKGFKTMINNLPSGSSNRK